MDKEALAKRLQDLQKPQVLLAVIAVLLVVVLIMGVALFQQPRQSGVAATVNGEEIMKDELFDVMYGQGGREALDQLITRKLINQAAAKDGITVTEEELDEEIKTIIDDSFEGMEEEFLTVLDYYGITIESFRDDARLNLLVRKIALEKIETTDEDARKFFEEHWYLFGQPEEVEARHILVETRAEAQDIVAMLKADGDFVQLASEYSLDLSNKDNGGHIGFFSRGSMVEAFEEVAFNLEIGEISDPVETDFGFHIIEVLDRKEEVEVKFENVQEDVIDTMIEDQIPAVINALVQSLYEEAEIEYVI